MSRWVPLSVRRGLAEPDGPYEGVPDHLRTRLLEWVEETLHPRFAGAEEKVASLVALQLRIPAPERSTRLGAVLNACRDDEDAFLDVLDLALAFTQGRTAEDLELQLLVGGSVWTVAADHRSLVRRVSEGEQEAYDRAQSPADEVSDELRTAWAAVYGRNPDPSDAWDHAIKAVELSLWPIVTPDDAKATLGKIIERLGRKPDKFFFRLATSSTKASNIEAVVQLLRLLWPNPDRHGTGERRAPTLQEAQNIVQLAVLLVGWVRSDALTEAWHGAGSQ
ncbi:hypothetical protein JD79_04102 [Geodermatophilus normandii]|uniref:Abortive infection Abi-like protein n=1 Tax=Geodermatophilus normandii TaxID=1137989 RepID=A0A317QT44_9ACTN|nr:hypothetical protein [Geodermatophilus normandii]PWW24910.1 hypothetical protein JD79_04102 [Geodermatophilus normandii]